MYIYIKSVDQNSFLEDINCSYFPVPRNTSVITFLSLLFFRDFCLEHDESGPQYYSTFNYYKL